jgi:hypothetical protein
MFNMPNIVFQRSLKGTVIALQMRKTRIREVRSTT